MEIRVAGRHAPLTDAIRDAAGEGVARIARVMGNGCSAHITLTRENARQTAEVTIATKRHTIVAKADGFKQDQVLQTAMQRAESQAQRYRTRQRARKRRAAAQ